MRLMVDLARNYGNGTVSLHAVAEREQLPEAYLEQLVAVLRKAGLVNGKRGAGGGYDRITVVVVNAEDGSVAQVNREQGGSGSG